VPEKYPIIFTEKQHKAIIHCSRLRRGLKARIEQAEPGTQVVQFTRKELDEFQSEVGQAVYYAVTPYKRHLLSVVKKIADTFEADMLELRQAKTPPRKVTGTTVFQLKITLQGIKPLIWRQVQVKDCTLATLHEVIQVAMGWEFSHLYDFEVAGERYGDPGIGDDLEWNSDRKMKLSQIVRGGHRNFTYVYDMGDNWQHTITVEGTLAPEPKAKYPRCIGGARACPPEDCGGVWGYEEFLEAIGNRKHKEHQEMLEWVGGEFDPEEFNMGALNGEWAKWRK
jgi:hypothetical protein